MKITLKTLLAASIALACSPAIAADMRLLAPAAGDQVPAKLTTAKGNADSSLDRAPASFSWSLETTEKLVAATPFTAESTEYWTEADGAALAKGLKLATTVPDAVVRISPMQSGGSAKALRVDAIEIRQGGKALGTRAIATADVAQEFDAVGMPLPAQSVSFRLGNVSPGAFELAVAGGNGRYLVHVFEPASTEKLQLVANRTSTVAGDRVVVSGRYAGSLGKRLGRVAGMATSPDGTSIPLDASVGKDGAFSFAFDANAAGGAKGLWEIHAFATTDDGSVQRDAKTAIAVASASAKFDGRVRVEASDKRAGVVGAPAVTVGVDVGSASRYDVSGVLYGTDAKGALVPAAIAHTAAWLDPGTRELSLKFDEKTLRAAGLGRPFGVRDLTLTNQGELAVVEKRARGVRID